MTAPPRTPFRQPMSAGRGLFGPYPTVGAGEAAKAVAEDASRLVRAEVDLAKAELAASAKEKATGAGLLVGAAILGWLAFQGLLITAALALALVLPLWAAALIISVVLLVFGAGLGLVAKNKLSGPMSLDTTKRNLEEDLSWTKSHLPSK